jgi:hypothetical protein
MTYADALQSWRDFYVTAGAAAATLVGLLFVGLSIHIQVVVAHAEVRSLARVTLAGLPDYAVGAALSLLTPGRACAGLQVAAAESAELPAVDLMAEARGESGGCSSTKNAEMMDMIRNAVIDHAETETDCAVRDKQR